MKIVEQYRQYAALALKKSRDAVDPVAKREWLNIAEEWTALAEARLLVLAQSGARH